MHPLLKPKPETIQRQNVELRARLVRADRLIAQLRAETVQLRAQLAQRQRSPVAPQTDRRDRVGRRSRSTLQERAFGSGHAAKPVLLRSAPPRYHRRPPASRLSLMRLLPRRLVGLALLAIGGFAVATFLSMHSFRLQSSHQQRSVPPTPVSQQPQPTPSQPAVQKPQTIAELVYNVQQPPQFESSSALQTIVDGAVALAASKDLPTESLSITLIDLKTKQMAGYQNQVPRYPASVVKLFWLVACEAQLEHGFLQPDPALSADLAAMAVHSDNDAASRIFDRITQTTSGSALSGEAYDTWLKQRLQLHHFFQSAGYSGLSISQKNYPIYSLRLEAPDGRELQMRDAQQQPIRSLVTADQAARLMYEIASGMSVSASRSQEMMALLTRDLQSEWKKDPNNAIAGFLGELLPTDVRFASKVGMTTKARHEVAFVTSKDGKTSYILAVFGADPTYSQNSEILPAISKAVFSQMSEQPSSGV